MALLAGSVDNWQRKPYLFTGPCAVCKPRSVSHTDLLEWPPACGRGGCRATNPWFCIYMASGRVCKPSYLPAHNPCHVWPGNSLLEKGRLGENTLLCAAQSSLSVALWTVWKSDVSNWKHSLKMNQIKMQFSWGWGGGSVSDFSLCVKSTPAVPVPQTVRWRVIEGDRRSTPSTGFHVHTHRQACTHKRNDVKRHKEGEMGEVRTRCGILESNSHHTNS